MRLSISTSSQLFVSSVFFFFSHWWWDSGKTHIKRISINYCKDRGKCKVVERNILSSLAAHLKSHIDSGRLSFLPVPFYSVSSSCYGC